MAHKEIQYSGKFDALGLAAQDVATTTKTGNFWGLGNAKSALFVVVIGAYTAAVTLKVLQGTATGTTGGTTKAVSGKTTTLGSGDANSIKLIEVEDSELDVADGYNSVALQATAAGGGALLGAACIRTALRYEHGYIT